MVSLFAIGGFTSVLRQHLVAVDILAQSLAIFRRYPGLAGIPGPISGFGIVESISRIERARLAISALKSPLSTA